ncbi:MAG: poly(3-hydroxyalkanoate) depolymerase [Streptosporangiaceae bacterium]
MSTSADTIAVRVGDQLLRVSVRPGRQGRRGWPGRPATPGSPVPLLLINGIGASLELLQPFVDALDPAIEVIRFDVPGVGGSPRPAGPYRFTGLSRLIGAMLAELGYDRTDVLGISWGGGVAQQFAFSQRARCRRLVLVSTGTGALMVPAKPSVLARMLTPRRYTDRGHLEQIAAELYGGSARADPASVAAAMSARSSTGSFRGYVYQLAAGAGWTSVPFLPRLKQPTLIMSGDDDPIIPLVNAKIMHRLIPDARLHVFHGGHLGLVTEATQLAPVIAGFLTEPGWPALAATSRPPGTQAPATQAPATR